MMRRIVPFLFIFFILLHVPASASLVTPHRIVHAAWQAPTPDDGKPQAIDIVLLVDSSGSTGTSDPDNLRLSAAAFLLDYVLAAGQTIGLNHRFAVTNFNTDVLDIRPLGLLQDAAIDNSLVPRNDGYTDFLPPFRFALNELSAGNFTTDRNMVVVLFTDGHPELLDANGQPQTVDPNAYFTNLGHTIKQLQEAGVQVFVVAIGDAVDDRQLWIDKAGITATNYRTIDNTTNLADVYHSFLADLLGLQTTATDGLAGGGSFSTTVPPYLEQIVFSVVKTSPAVVGTLREPSGAIVPPTQGGGNALHEVYVIPEPRSGWWQLDISGGDAQIWLDQRLPLLMVQAPEQPAALAGDVEIDSQLLRLGRPVVDNNLVIQLAITLPSGQVVRRDMASKSNGSYILNLADLLTEPGSYGLAVSAQLAGYDLDARTTPASVSAFPVPQIQYIDIAGERVVSEPITITAHIVNAEVLAPDTTIPVRIRASNGDMVGSIDLRDDGISPDETAADGLFTAGSSFPTVAGIYMFDLRLEGATRDGVAFNLRPQIPNVVIERLPNIPIPVVSATPALSTATTTPTATPTSISTPAGSSEIGRQNMSFNFGWLLFLGMTTIVASGGVWFFRGRLLKEKDYFQEKVREWNQDREYWQQEKQEYSIQQQKWDQEKERLQEEVNDLRRRITKPKDIDQQLKNVEARAKSGDWDVAENIVESIILSIDDKRATAMEAFTKQYENVADKWLKLLDDAESGRLKGKGEIKDKAEIHKRRDEFVTLLARDNNREAIIALMRALEQHFWKGDGARALSYLYSTIFEGGNVELILDVITKEEIGPIYQLFRCIQGAQNDPTPENLEKVATAAEELLGDSRSGMVKLYQLLSRIARCSPSRMTVSQKDFDEVKKLLEDDGLKSLAQVVVEASRMVGD